MWGNRGAAKWQTEVVGLIRARLAAAAGKRKQNPPGQRGEEGTRGLRYAGAWDGGGVGPRRTWGRGGQEGLGVQYGEPQGASGPITPVSAWAQSSGLNAGGCLGAWERALPKWVLGGQQQAWGLGGCGLHACYSSVDRALLPFSSSRRGSTPCPHPPARPPVPT